MIFSIAFLIILFGVIPISLCLIIDKLKKLTSSYQSKWLNFLIYYGVTASFVYGIGYLLAVLSESKIKYLPLKLVLIITMAFAIYGFYWWFVNYLGRLIVEKLGDNGIVVPNYMAYFLMILTALMVYGLFRFVLKDWAVLDWLFNQLINF